MWALLQALAIGFVARPRGGASESLVGAIPADALDRIKQTLVGLKMPRAIEILDVILRRLEHWRDSPPSRPSTDGRPF